MIVQIANLHFAFGMQWVMSHEKKDTRLIKSQFSSKASFYVCQAGPSPEGESKHLAWLGFYPMKAMNPSIPQSKHIHCAALCVAALVQDAIVLQPLQEGCVWLCVIKGGVPVVGFDLLLNEAEIQPHLEFCKRVFKRRDPQTQPEVGAEPRPFEVLEAFELLKALEVQKSKDRALRESLKASRLKPLKGKRWFRLRPIVLTLSAALVLSILSGLALGGGLVGVLNDKSELSILPGLAPSDGLVLKLRNWVSKAFFPGHEREESMRLAALAAQSQEAQMRAEKRQFALNEKRFLDQRSQLRRKVSALEFWQEFNRVRHSVPISFMGHGLRQLRCVPSQCDLDWSKEQAGFQNVLSALPNRSINSSFSGAGQNPLTHVELNLNVVPMALEEEDSSESLLQAMKEDFAHVPINWSASSSIEYSPALGSTQGPSGAASNPRGEGVRAPEDKWLLANAGEWSLTLSAETMLVQGDEFIKRLAKWPLEVSEINYLRNETLSFKGKWFYFPKGMGAR